MKTKIFIIGLICIFFICCYMNYSQRFVYYPKPPDVLFDQMTTILQDLGYTIDTEEKTPNPLVSKDPYMIAKREKHKAMITFKRRHGETEIEIHVSQIGEKIKTEFLDKYRDEIAEKFAEIMKQ